MNSIQNYGMANYQLNNNSTAFKAKKQIAENILKNMKELKTGEMSLPSIANNNLSVFNPSLLLYLAPLASAGAISACGAINPVNEKTDKQTLNQ